jgi:hypothetical protein
VKAAQKQKHEENDRFTANRSIIASAIIHFMAGALFESLTEKSPALRLRMSQGGQSPGGRSVEGAQIVQQQSDVF